MTEDTMQHIEDDLDEVVTEYEQTVAGFNPNLEDNWTKRQIIISEDSRRESRAEQIDALRIIAMILEDHPLIPHPDYISSWRNGKSSALHIGCNSAAEMRACVRAFGKGAKEFNEMFERQQIVWKHRGLDIVAYRSDQVCEMVEVIDEDGNPVTEEITVREEVAPAKVREVVKTVTKTERRCPDSLLED